MRFTLGFSDISHSRIERLEILSSALEFDRQTWLKSHRGYSSSRYTYISPAISLISLQIRQSLDSIALITDSIAKLLRLARPPAPVLPCRFFVLIFHSWKIRGESKSSEFYPAWLFARKNPGLPGPGRTISRTFWHGAISPFTPRRVVAKKGNGRKAFSRNVPPSTRYTAPRDDVAVTLSKINITTNPASRSPRIPSFEPRSDLFASASFSIYRSQQLSKETHYSVNTLKKKRSISL